MQKNSNSFIFRSVYQIDMKFDRQLWPATKTSRVVSYGGKTIPIWRTAAILKIDISPYLCEKSAFHEILYTAADFELGERHVIKNEKVALDRLRFRQNVFLFVTKVSSSHTLNHIFELPPELHTAFKIAQLDLICIASYFGGSTSETCFI